MYIGYRKGVVAVLGDKTLLFDHAVTGESGLRLVSHAHSDHTPARLKEDTVMTPETRELASVVRPLVGEPSLRRLNDIIRMDSLRIRLLNAGHVLGSSQFLVESDYGSMLYTGDINTYDTIVSKHADVTDADMLVVEATYGNPSYSFPPREEIYGDIIRWILTCVKQGKIPAFKTYSIGKSQEIIKLINLATKLPVITGPVVSRVCEAYERCGVRLDFIPAKESEGMEVLNSGECVYVDSMRRKLPTSKRVRWALATGWALKYKFRNYDKAFPLSSHADFKGIIEFAQQIKPSKVYTIHGYTVTLAKELQRRGIDAAPLDELNPSGGLL